MTTYYELRARAVAVVRRFRAGGRRTLLADAIRVDVAGRRAWLRHDPIELSRLEFDLLCKLASDPARVFTKDELLGDLWPGSQLSRSTRTLDSHACRLRRKLRAQGDWYLENLWGVGYRLTSRTPRGRRHDHPRRQPASGVHALLRAGVAGAAAARPRPRRGL
jgi:DNA-binding response OmpR family regulator